MIELDQHLAYIRQASPFYSDVPENRLPAFPILDRALLRANLDSLLTVRGTPKIELLRQLDTFRIQAPHHTVSEFRFSDHIYIEQTSGSSGVPLRLPKTVGERTQLSVAAWKYRLGYDKKITRDNFLAIFHRHEDAPLPVNPFVSSVDQVLTFYHWVNEKNYRWIHAPPSVVSYHAGLLHAVGCRRPAPSLRYIETSGSPLDARAAQMISDVFEVEIVNQYGTRETWSIGHASRGQPFVLNDSAVVVELVDTDGKCIEGPDREGDVVVTSRVLRLLPIVRYRTGDRGCWVGRTDQAMTLTLSADRHINTLIFNGVRVSGNILFKEVLHRIDHQIGYGYARFMQIRKKTAFEFELILFPPDFSSEIAQALREFLVRQDPRHTLQLSLVTKEQSEELMFRKPYLFVNECQDAA